MRRNSDLELRLLPSSYHGDDHDMVEKSRESPENQLQQLTIFYNGEVCVCNVTELQARAILMEASREMVGESIKTPTTTGSEPVSPSTVQSHQLCSLTTALSMKRSLQQFLLKRKNRIQATSPYH